MPRALKLSVGLAAIGLIAAAPASPAEEAKEAKPRVKPMSVVGLGAAVAVAKETINVGSSVKLEFRYGSAHGPPPAFLGSVNASHGCQKGRRVIVTHDHERVYADTSDNRGKYKIGVARHDLHPVWNYRAVAKGRKIAKNDGDKIVCERGTSNLIHPGVGG